mgnify:CR=1 FL=1
MLGLDQSLGTRPCGYCLDLPFYQSLRRCSRSGGRSAWDTLDAQIRPDTVSAFCCCESRRALIALLNSLDLGAGVGFRHPDAILRAVRRVRRRGVGFRLIFFVVEPILVSVPLAFIRPFEATWRSIPLALAVDRAAGWGRR